MDVPEDISELKQRLERLAERESWFRARSVQEILGLKKTIKLLRAENAELRETVTDRETRIHELNLARVEDVEERHALLRDLEDYAVQLAAVEQDAAATARRLAELRGSPSWRFTAPLRSLQKAFGPKAPSQPPTTSSEGAATGAALTYYFHASPFRLHREPTVTLRGWVLPPAGRRITGVRVWVNGTATTGRVGLPEPDVARQHALVPPDDQPGFELSLAVVPGVQRAAFEVQLDDGTWRQFLDVPLRGAPPHKWKS